MRGDLNSVRLLVVSGSSPARALLRQGSGVMTIPVEVMEADSAAAALTMLAAKEIDIVLVDAAIAASDQAELTAAARVAKQQPLVIVMTPTKNEAVELAASGGTVDAVVVKPAAVDQAKVLIERCNRLRQPSRVLVVDDSSTMRSIVRKVLAASRFRLDIIEAAEGIEALKEISTGRFDVVFLDHNMPGLNGVETLSEIKRQYPRTEVVIMTSSETNAVVERARVAGAAAFLKKPFYPPEIDALLHSVFGLRGGR